MTTIVMGRKMAVCGRDTDRRTKRLGGPNDDRGMRHNATDGALFARRGLAALSPPGVYDNRRTADDAEWLAGWRWGMSSLLLAE